MTTEPTKTYLRFSVSQRIEHAVLLISFTTLAVTGLPQKFVGQGWAETMIAVLGGIETVRIIHRTAAIVLLIGSIYHLAAAGYRFFVLHRPLAILPSLQDVLDFFTDISYYLGLRRHGAHMGRYTYAEKIEYWAVVWGTVIMALTGFMLWNPITTTRFLPGDFVPAAKAAHGGEAILAVLSILTWHVYHVHLKRFNKSMFTGKLTREEMEEEHPLELLRIERGEAPIEPDPETRRRRERIYIPIAATISALLLVGVYGFASYEQTAITTLPQRATITPFVPATPTPTPPATPTRERAAGVAGAIPHPIAGREQCSLCHALGAMRPFPDDHVGRSDESCTVCHAVAAATTEPTATAISETPTAPAAIAATATGVITSPVESAPITVTVTATLAATGTPTLAAPAGPIPHELEGRENCLLCHDRGAVVPFPADHVGRSNESCQICHQPAAASPQASAAPGFAGDVLPIFQAKCVTCHGQMGGLDLTTYDSVMRGGQSGPIVVASEPERSLLIAKMQGTHPAQLSESELSTVRAWIAAGAPNN
jgi:cytochrome b subunit of formate dehydrogenase